MKDANGEIKKIIDEMGLITKLLILLAKKSGVSGVDIAKAMGYSEGRISQLLDHKKYQKKKR